jgi:hypothetical protein
VGVRDPYTIENIDAVIDWARRQAAERFGPTGDELHHTVYGRPSSGSWSRLRSRRATRSASSSRR